jgi:hypothetical protein
VEEAKVEEVQVAEGAQEPEIEEVTPSQPKAASVHRQPPASARPKAEPAPLDENGPERRLWELLDSKGKGQVGKRDMLVALKKQPPVRKLFGLPVAANDKGGDKLESRLMAIQESFEGGSGLGELTPVWEQLVTALDPSATAGFFTWEHFAARIRKPPLRQRVSQAAAFLHREHGTGPEFVATKQWQEVPEGYTCPGGLEYKMDLSTGKTLARLAPASPKTPARPPATPSPATPSPAKASPAPPKAAPKAAPAAPLITAATGGIQQWEVVGGADKGGILVRQGMDLKSPQEAVRLSTGALVEEIELAGERLHFRRLTGTGPAEGWVSLKLGDKVLMERRSVGAQDVD